MGKPRDSQAKADFKDGRRDFNPVTTQFEFFGPPGALAVTLLTPAFTYILYAVCNEGPPRIPQKWFSLEASALYTGWFALHVILWLVLPGKWVEGQRLRDGTILEYKMNGLSTLAVIAAIVGTALRHDLHALDFIIDQTVPLMTASLIAAILLALHSYLTPGLRALGGNSGNVAYDFFIGRTLNPRLGSFDFKVFCELRPGMNLWLLLNTAYLARQYTQLGRLTDSMQLVYAFQAWYIVDSVINERKVLSTMDVTTDGFGFMLSFGDLCWVPFTYSIQARYLSTRVVDLGPRVLYVLALQLIGYFIFRSANSQKDAYRASPDSMPNMRFVQTRLGTRLLADGWWGYSRHINYLGDWLMSWAWSLPTGFTSPFTYFYPVYFAVLLIHRERRDDEKCHNKYGADWEKYRELVPYRIIPGVY
ncbi:erg24, C-14 sterol reductase [Savitreella phatthalungensis]